MHAEIAHGFDPTFYANCVEVCFPRFVDTGDIALIYIKGQNSRVQFRGDSVVVRHVLRGQAGPVIG